MTNPSNANPTSLQTAQPLCCRVLPAALGLLVSVRSAAEAATALAGGATLIDIKEPVHGPLGRADDTVIAAVVSSVAGRCPVSAALGELIEGVEAPACAGLRYVKWGLAGALNRDWRSELHRRMQQPGPQMVVVAYADWQCAAAPRVDEVVEFACERPGSVLLVDTCCKDPSKLGLRRRPTLLDWLSVQDVFDLCARCRRDGVQAALAGSLGRAEIEALLSARPTWFAVRGAVCDGGNRTSLVHLDKVRHLADMLTTAASRSAG